MDAALVVVETFLAAVEAEAEVLTWALVAVAP